MMTDRRSSATFSRNACVHPFVSGCQASSDSRFSLILHSSKNVQRCYFYKSDTVWSQTKNLSSALGQVKHAIRVTIRPVISNSDHDESSLCREANEQFGSQSICT